MSHHQRHDDHSWVVNMPAVVACTLAVIVVIHVVRQFLPQAIDDYFVIAMAFIPARYAGDPSFTNAVPGGQLAMITSPFTHMLVHGNWMHLFFNSAWLLAFGSAIAARISVVRFLLLTVLCAASGAILFAIVNFAQPAPMIGASGAISGLMGAAMRFFFNAMDYGGFQILRNSPRAIPVMTLSHALSDQRVLMVTALWLMLNFLAVIGFGSLGAETGGVAWEAHIGGYLAGFLSFGLFDKPPLRPSARGPTLH